MWEYLCGNEKQVRRVFYFIVVHHLLCGWISPPGFALGFQCTKQQHCLSQWITDVMGKASENKDVR